MIQPPARNTAGDTLAEENDIDYTKQYMTTDGTKWMYHAYLFPEVTPTPAGAATLGSGTSSSNNTSAPPNRLIGTIGDIARRPISAGAQQNRGGQGATSRFQTSSPPPEPYEYFYKTYTRWEPIITTVAANGKPDQKHPLLKGKYRFNTAVLKWKNTSSFSKANRNGQDTVKTEAPRSSTSTENKVLQDLLRRYQAATAEISTPQEPSATSVEILSKIDLLLKDNSSMRDVLREQTTKINRMQFQVDYIEHMTRDTVRVRRQEEKKDQSVKENDAIVIDGDSGDEDTSNSDEEDESQSSKSSPVDARASGASQSEGGLFSPSPAPLDHDQVTRKGKAPQRSAARSQALRALTYTPPRT